MKSLKARSIERKKLQKEEHLSNRLAYHAKCLARRELMIKLLKQATNTI